MAPTLEQLSDLVGTLQTRVGTLETEVKQYRQDILDLETQLSKSIITERLKVSDDAQITERHILTDGQMLDSHDVRLTSHDSTLNTHDSTLISHEGRLVSHDSTLISHEGRLTSHDGTLNTHDSTLIAHEGRLTSHDGVLNIHEGSISIPGDIHFGATLSTSGRMHINGEELLFLLNKQGVIVGKHWGGNGNLTVEGEIKGKLWVSDEFTLNVPNNGSTASIKMLAADKCFAFITSMSGKFEGGGERVWVEIRGDGYWYLCGHALQGGVGVHARCAGMP